MKSYTMYVCEAAHLGLTLTEMAEYNALNDAFDDACGACLAVAKLPMINKYKT